MGLYTCIYPSDNSASETTGRLKNETIYKKLGM